VTVLIASPLSRALMTADLAFPAYVGPREVCALARERLFHASDMGWGPPQYCQPRDTSLGAICLKNRGARVQKVCRGSMRRRDQCYGPWRVARAGGPGRRVPRVAGGLTGRAVQIDPMKLTLKAPRNKRLKP
jgi:hypothetical protein